MARIVTLEEAQALRAQDRHWAYNALDCTGTREVLDVLRPRLDPDQARIYAFERALQSPAMAMMRRGVVVNQHKRNEAVTELRREVRALEKDVNKLEIIQQAWDGVEKDTGACKQATRKDGKHKWPRGVSDDDLSKVCEDCGAPRWKRKPFNPNSSHQTLHLFYGALGVKPMTNKKGEVSVDEDVLVRIEAKHPELADLCQGILEVRDRRKQIGFLTAKLSPAGRFPSSFNVGAAWTGRFSSSKNPYGQGSNLQNISERHRRVFEADPGYELFYADLEQAESRTVAYVSGDEEYIQAHLAGDVHTYACRLIWPELDWTGDLKADKAVAKQNPPWDDAPGHDYRFQAKRIQHGSNYGLSPYGISKIARIPIKEAKRAYEMYFDAFPQIKAWHREIAEKVRNQEPLYNPLGRKVRLFGRPWDEHTFKQGLAFIPQSLVADVLNLSLWHVWNDLDPEPVMLLGQIHDAVMGQWKKECRLEAARAVVERMVIPIPIGDRVMEIPVEIEAGRNWGHANEENPHGLRAVEGL